MTYSKIPRVMLLTIAVLGLMSVASACEICGHKYEQVGDKQVPVEGWTIYLEKMVNGEFKRIAETTTNEFGEYCFRSPGNLPADEVTKSVYGTYRVYEEVRDGWTQLSPSAGYYEVELKQYPVSERTVSGLDFVNQQDKVCYKEETAWAAGTRYVQKGNWATYTPYSGGEKTVDIFAGQHIYVGTAKFTENVDKTVTITINLKNGAAFTDVQENLKIQGYDSGSKSLTKNPAPGKFTTYKGTITGGSATVTVPQYAYYGIHLDVKVPCQVT